MNTHQWFASLSVSALASLFGGPALADCSALPPNSALKAALVGAVGQTGNGGLGFNMWATIVANDGTVCAVAFSGSSYTSQWLASRVISAQKANTANGLSLGNNSTPASSVAPGGLALSTANLFTAVQPGGSLYGLQHSNPVDTDVAYGNKERGGNGFQNASLNGNGNAPSDAATFGTASDPMVGQRVGGVNVFGGGLALFYNGVKVGAVGVSGDTSCTDHMVAWRVRNSLGLDYFKGSSATVGGVSGDPDHPDNIIFDIVTNPDGTGGTGQSPSGSGGVGTSPSGFGHPQCLNPPTLSSLPPVHH